MTYNIQEENTYRVASECLSLGRDHYNEVESKSKAIPYDADQKMINMMLDAGMISIVTARLDGKLVGYYASLCGPDFQTKTTITKEIGIYVAPAHRGQGLFKQMLDKTEAIAKERGIKLMLIMFKVGQNEQLAEENGFEKTETIFQKVLI